MGENQDKPALIFDGDCGICTTSAEWVAARRRRPAAIVPWQSLDLEALGLSQNDVTRFAWWIDERGRKSRGHRAIARALIACRQPWPIVGWLLLLPPITWLAAVGYRLVANNRGLLPGATPACRREGGFDLGD